MTKKHKSLVQSNGLMVAWFDKKKCLFLFFTIIIINNNKKTVSLIIVIYSTICWPQNKTDAFKGYISKSWLNGSNAPSHEA